MTDGVAQGIRLLAGRYEVGELIGRGGMADVHEGVDARLGRRVAIKLLRPQLATDPAFRSRFRREAQDAAKMAHPTIVRIFDAGEETIVDADGVDAQVPFIIMERVDGKLLSQLIANGPMDPHQAVGIIEQVLTALEYSHRAGLVHRDIKPGNIMITSTGQVKVMDFGIARAISEVSATIAEQSTIVGTAQYFSPEQARGEAIDARADLYSTGIVLFEMLTGRAPFVGENPVAVAYQHVNQQAARPSAINPRVSPALDAVVLRAIGKDRFERYQSAADFRSELQSADAGTVAIKRPVQPTPATATLFGVNPSATAGSEATVRQLAVDDRTRGARSSQSRPPVAWIWAGILVVIVIIVAVLYWTVNVTNGDNRLAVGNSVVVPDVTGEPWSDVAGTPGVESRLRELGLNPVAEFEASDTVAADIVLGTEPAADIRMTVDDTVTVTVSSGADSVAVPTIVGLTVDEARARLAELGLGVDENLTMTPSPNIAAGVITGSTPQGGSEARTGTAVSLIVSDGQVVIPDVVGQELGAAVRTLRGADFQLTVTQSPDLSCAGNAVAAQSAVGPAKQHAEVELTYCAKIESTSNPAPPAG